MATLTHSTPLAGTGSSWIETKLAVWRDYRAERRRINDTIAELQSLSDRELADLGMHRSNIRRVATEAVQNG